MLIRWVILDAIRDMSLNPTPKSVIPTCALAQRESMPWWWFISESARDCDIQAWIPGGFAASE